MTHDRPSVSCRVLFQPAGWLYEAEMIRYHSRLAKHHMSIPELKKQLNTPHSPINGVGYIPYGFQKGNMFMLLRAYIPEARMTSTDGFLSVWLRISNHPWFVR